MNVRLKAEQVALIQEMIHAGHFCVPEEAIEAAVWLLKDAYELHKVKRDELRKLIAVGVEQADRGELIDADVVFRQLAEKIEKRSGPPT